MPELNAKFIQRSFENYRVLGDTLREGYTITQIPWWGRLSCSHKPLVSVILPCYGMGRYIADALSAINAQVYTNWEVLAVDDCGPEDGTRGCVERLSGTCPEGKIRYLRHDSNKGVSAARNTGIKAARGDLLAFLDPDDKWDPSFLRVHVATLCKNRNLALVYTDARFITEEGTILDQCWGPTPAESANVLLGMYRRNFVNPSTVVCRREEIEQHGGFDESPDIQHVEDWDLWLRLLRDGAVFHYNPEAISYRRIHSVGATQQVTEMRRRYVALRNKHMEDADFRNFMASYIRELEEDNARLAALLRKTAPIAETRSNLNRRRVVELLSDSVSNALIIMRNAARKLARRIA